MNDTNKKFRNGINEIVDIIKKEEKFERLTKDEIRGVINCLWETVLEKIKSGKEEVTFYGRFTFTTKEIEEKKATTSKSFGKETKQKAIPAHRQIKVKVQPGLKKSFREETSEE